MFYILMAIIWGAAGVIGIWNLVLHRKKKKLEKEMEELLEND